MKAVASMELEVSPEHRHLIILDGHASHVSLTIVKEAHQHGIDLLTLPNLLVYPNHLRLHLKHTWIIGLSSILELQLERKI